MRVYMRVYMRISTVYAYICVYGAIFVEISANIFANTQVYKITACSPSSIVLPKYKSSGKHSLFSFELTNPFYSYGFDMKLCWESRIWKNAIIYLSPVIWNRCHSLFPRVCNDLNFLFHHGFLNSLFLDIIHRFSNHLAVIFEKQRWGM